MKKYLIALATVVLTFAFFHSEAHAFYVQATTNGSGSGSVACSVNGGSYGTCSTAPAGSTVVFQASPSGGSSFTGWGGICAGVPSASCTKTITADSMASATFVAPGVFYFDLNGWAWSSNIGWINFNCLDVGNCMNPYKVKVSSLDGSMTGYAWSPSIGWIQFGSLAGFPAAGASATNAKVSTTTGKVTGWARACAGTVKLGDSTTNPTVPGDCSSMTKRPDGWDGWIELSGPLHSSTIDTTTGKISGFAWGGDVVGWLNFNVVTTQGGTPITGVTCSTNCGVINGGGPSLTVSCSLFSGTNPTLAGTGVQWSSTVSGSSVGPYNFTFKWGDGQPDTSWTQAAGFDREAHTYTAAGTYNIQVVVTDGTTPTPITGTSPICQQVVTAPAVPVFSLTSGPSAAPSAQAAHDTVNSALPVRQGSPFVLVRTITGLNAAYDSCNTSVDKGTWAWTSVTPSVGDSNTPFTESGGDTKANVTGLYEFSLQCISTSDPGSYPAMKKDTYIRLRSVSEGEI